MLWRRVGVSVAGLAWVGACGVAEGAAVKVVNKKKAFVAIELEEDETVEKGTTVCFYTEAGKKVECGTVTRVKGTLATVKVEDEAALAKVKKGMAAKVGESDDEAAGDDEGGKKKKKAKAKKKKKGESAEEGEAGLDSEDNEAAAKAYKGKKSPFRVWVGYGPAIATPAAYNRLSYNYNGSPTPASTWSADKKVAQTLVGFDLQLGIPLGAFSVNPGLRYRKFTPSLVDADYTPNHENPYVSTEQQATALGLFADFQYFKLPIGPKGMLNLTTGLDIDQSTVTATATLKDDTGTVAQRPVASATSKLTVISLRVGANVDYTVAKPFGVFGGLTALVPLTEVGKSFSGSMQDTDANANPKAANPGADIEAALGHKKNTFGLEMTFGGVLSF